jgi:hypothetical protein
LPLAHGLSIEWLPTSAPKLTDIHVVWRDLKAHHLGHQTFADADAVDRAIHQAIDPLNASAPTFRWSGHESLLGKCDVSGIRLTSVTPRDLRGGLLDLRADSPTGSLVQATVARLVILRSNNPERCMSGHCPVS